MRYTHDRTRTIHGLFALAKSRRDPELKGVALLALLSGGGRVLLFDLLGFKGLPAVASLLSFVLAAAYGSMVVRREERESGS